MDCGTLQEVPQYCEKHDVTQSLLVDLLGGHMSTVKLGRSGETGVGAGG